MSPLLYNFVMKLETFHDDIHIHKDMSILKHIALCYTAL